MNARPPPDTLGTMLAWIERHLDDPLTLEIIAKRSGYSPYHFARLFLARTRRSVMAHVRGRRLVRSARRLLAEPDLRLIDLAFDCGFDSQEAFTRAFKRMFGVSPARFHAGFAVEPMEGQFPMTTSSVASTAVTRSPDLVFRDRFVVAGPTKRFDKVSAEAIPQLWSRLVGALPFTGQIESRASYGVVWDFDREHGSFRYLAGVEIEPGAAAPAGFEAVTIEAATYAVFRIVLDGGPIHLQIKAAMTEIWERMIPASGLTFADGPDFEFYDGRIPLTEPGAFIDFHLPVKV